MEEKEVEVSSRYIEIAFTLPKLKAKAIAKEYLDRYPKIEYDTHITNWYETKDKKIYFTIKRLSNCN